MYTLTLTLGLTPNIHKNDSTNLLFTLATIPGL